MMYEPFVPILTMYGLIMSCALVVLILAFGKDPGSSGRLYVASEIMKLIVLVIIGAVQVYPDMLTESAFFVANLLFLSSEVSFGF